MALPVNEDRTFLFPTSNPDTITAVAEASNGFQFESFEYRNDAFVGVLTSGSGQQRMAATVTNPTIDSNGKIQFHFDHIGIHRQSFKKTDPR